MPRLLLVPLLACLAGCGSAAPSATQEPSAATAEAAATGSLEPTAPSTQAPAAEVPWEVLDDAPFARLEMAVAAHGGRIWMAGGYSPTGAALTEVDVFDPATGEWTDGPPLPTGMHHAALVSDGSRLLFIGGYIGPDFNRVSDLVLVLADGDSEWREGPALPAPRAAGAAAWDGARVVYAGGVGSGVASDVYVLEGETWERLGSMARPREHLAATTDGAGTVWLMGGRVMTLSTNLSIVETVTADGIAMVEPVPTPRGGVAAFYDDDLGACLTGGESPTEAFTTVECVDVDGTVTVLPPLNEPHHGHGAAVVDGVAYVVLGGPEPTLSADSVIEALPLDP